MSQMYTVYNPDSKVVMIAPLHTIGAAFGLRDATLSAIEHKCATGDLYSCHPNPPGGWYGRSHIEVAECYSF